MVYLNVNSISLKQRKYILISDGKLHLSRDFRIDLSQVFPDSVVFKKMEIYWEVEGSYKNGKLLLKVVNYNPTAYYLWGTQDVKNSIEDIKFENLEQDKLKQFLSSDNNPTQKTSESQHKGQKNTTASGNLIDSAADIIQQYKKDPVQKTITEQFDVLYKDATIKNGMIVFEKKFSWYPLPIDIAVINSFLKEEFDAIKYYFGKVNNRKKRFSVHTVIKLVDNTITEVLATSFEIAQINEELIDVIKRARIKKAISSQSKNGKSLIDIDELFESIDGREGYNILNQSSEEIINEVITWKGIRNGKQLQYLSGLKQSKDKKMLFTLEPKFGFMFTITSTHKNYYCWELRDSHATYIWAIDNSAPTTRIEDIITYIQEVGRNTYRRQYSLALIDQDVQFERLIHSMNGESDPFGNWKSQLENFMRINS